MAKSAIRPGSTASPRVGFISLGCPKALVDSERILTQLRAEGYDIVSQYGEADLVVVNTCGFIDEAVQESLEAIGEALAENGRVIVTGCLGAKGDIVQRTHPKVLAVTGPHALEPVMSAIHKALPRPHDPFVDLVPPAGIRLTPRHYAYLKISEGCNHRCSFCIIPSMRGDLVSRPVDQVLNEAERLVASGVKELLVIAQDSSAYGVDLRYRSAIWRGRAVKTHITALAAALGELGVWVRLHYVYPYPHVDELIPLMAEGRVLPYLDIPFQHGSPRVLKAMRRPAAAEGTLARLAQWRAHCPQLTIRSTFIVGFPGETAAEFDRLLEFLSEAQLDRVGAFMYSPVAGAAANELPDAVPEEIKQERHARFMQHQAAISAQKLACRVGEHTDVLIDDMQPDGTGRGRSYGEAPEIDGQVTIERPGNARVGDMIRVRINASTEHDLFAERCDPT